MLFSLVKLSALEDRHGNYAYAVKIMEQAGSESFTTLFRDSEDMLNLMNGILARQRKRYENLRAILEKIRAEGVYFFDLEIDERSALLLGWKPKPGQ